MGNVAVFVQHNEGILTKTALVSIAVALQLKEAWKKAGVVAVCLGSGAEKACNEALQYGLDDGLYCNEPLLEKYLATTYAAALKGACDAGDCDTVTGVATTTVKDFFPRLAVMMDAAQASDIVAVNGDGSLTRPMYAGDILADVILTTDKRIISARGTAFAPAVKSSSDKKANPFSLKMEGVQPGEVVSYEMSQGGRPELADAEVVVSGGRALQSSENFEKYIFPLADALGAAVGASRAAVDSGYAPNDWQVGQTGKVVAPRLYIAVGISGAIQHLAGMKDSKTIVAINKDGDAPIFEVADYGLVADLFDAVPKFTESIKKAKGS
ncbi:MAG: electron transfer flavoprotein subunit alpha/FixB family protein [Deltaproteobacteria bacterium]|nr:electron transfer flavoprotein subunit alpha/FixB family protein [Deltaproteobacteria bacterium]